MDKRGVKILISCILCTVIVSILFLLAFRISRLTCELVSVDPQRLRVAQLEAFDKKRNKPIRSHDKMILMKISAYLEYNIMQKEEDDDDNERDKKHKTTTTTTSRPLALGGSPTAAAKNSSAPLANSAPGQPNSTPNQTSGSPQAATTTTTTAGQQQTAGGGATQQHPSPSQPQLAFTPQQLANSSFGHASGPNSAGQAAQLPMHQRAKRRFLPLELESIETRDKRTEGTGAQATITQKYILSFNCTKLNMVFSYQSNKVSVESMRLELKPTSNHKSICDLEMPKGLFEVHSSAALTNSPAASKSDHFAHYYCNKPLTYSCRHYSQHGPSSSNGLLLAELHISAIEFETATLGASSHGDRKHVKSEFKSRRSECGAAI